MSDGEVLILGAIAGFTIFLGLPIGRVRNPSLALRAFLNAVAVGILLFLFWDVLAGAFETVETALTDANDHGAVVVALPRPRRAVLRSHRGRSRSASSTTTAGWRPTRDRPAPGAASTSEMHAGYGRRLTEPQRLAFFIALGIGFHNFSEGLAIGQSAAAGEVSLALAADHRVRPAQRHRGVRHRRADGRRG